MAVQPKSKKRTGLVLFISATIFILLVTAILRVLTPSSPPVPQTPLSNTNFDNTQSQFSNVSYAGPTMTVPDQFTVAKLSRLIDRSREIEQTLIAAYKLTKHPVAPDVWMGKEYSLTKEPSESRYLLTKELAPSTTETIDATTAQRLAKEFVQQFLPDFNLEMLPSGMAFSASEGEFARESSGPLALVPFGSAIDGYPIFYQNQPTHLVEILVDRNGVRQANIFLSPLNFETIGIKPALSLAQALDNINQRQLGSIIASGFGVPAKLELSSIQKGDLTAVAIEYRTDLDSGLIYPFFHFKGKLTNAAGEELDAELITPAIATQ